MSRKIENLITERQFYNCAAKAIYTILGLINIADQSFFAVKIPVVMIKLQKCTYYCRNFCLIRSDKVFTSAFLFF